MVSDPVEIVDLHAHAPRFVPRPWRDLYRAVNRATMPPDADLATFAAAGVRTSVVCAVGDPVVTRWYRGDPFDAVVAQLDAATAQREATPGGDTTDIVFGLEGLDCIGSDLSRIDELARRGVRMIVPVHLADNQFGTTCLPWQHYVSSAIPLRRRRTPGLTELGAQAVEALQRAGIVVDVSHADQATMHGIVEASRPGATVIASHAGARAVSDFARFLDDAQLRAIAATGGVIGLWPYCHHGHGVPDLPALMDHARHIASTVGVDHLAIGTDVNGVPGTTAGYRGIADIGRLRDALRTAGFGAADISAVMAGNAERVLAGAGR